jgi:hypothetical protein
METDPMPKTQSLQNHARFDPLVHFFIIPVFFFTSMWRIYRLVREPSLESAWLVVLSFALLMAGFKIRLYPLKVQDRVIRLEERLRLSMLLSEPFRSRINDLTEGQLVAIRFASDAEVPGLVEKALAGKMAPADIKKEIVNWRPDYFRV